MPAKGFRRATVWPQVECYRARQSSLAAQATALQAILFRVARANSSTGARRNWSLRDDRLNPGEAATRTLQLVEQNVKLALDIADRAYVLDHGAVVYHAAARGLLVDNEIKER